jgi:hypothetical protein
MYLNIKQLWVWCILLEYTSSAQFMNVMLHTSDGDSMALLLQLQIYFCKMNHNKFHTE